MDLREMSTDRLVTVSGRSLAAASVLTTAAIVFATWTSWQQVGQSYSPEGPDAPPLPFGTKVSATVLEYSYRPGGLQLLVATVLVAAAVMALHLHPTRSRVRSLRWEVLGAGLVVLVAVTVLVLANVFVLTDPTGGNDENFFGPQPISYVAWANLGLLAAALLVLVLAALWWVRLATAPDDAVTDAVADDGEGESEGEESSARADDGDEPEHMDETPGALGATNRSPDRPAHGTFGEPTRDYSRDWSPEDFLPPR